MARAIRFFPKRGEPSEREFAPEERTDQSVVTLDSPETFEPGDHERFAHYVLKEKIVESAVTGKPVRALCGKKWVPLRDPEKFPLCPICKEIHSGLRKGPEDGSNSHEK